MPRQGQFASALGRQKRKIKDVAVPEKEFDPSRQSAEQLRQKINYLLSDPVVVAKRDADPVVLPKAMIRLYSDCAGMGCDALALTLCGLAKRCQLVGWTERDADKQKLHSLLCQQLQFPCRVKEPIKDVSARNHRAAQPCDLYVAGFPCPSFSALGKKRETRRAGAS